MKKNLDSLEDKRDYLSMRFTRLQTINNRNERVMTEKIESAEWAFDYEDELKAERDDNEKELSSHMEHMDEQAKDALPDPDEIFMDWEINFIESISAE
tara:strand:+ start:1191 stop:1484 length:294 start_codon:yes stop_codon:yes gene_type:complete